MASHKNKRFANLCERLQNDPGLPVMNPTVSHWQLPPSESVATKQSPEFPTETDVVVIGSGITGCSVAKQLLENDPSIRVTVLEARNICSGATGRNGGHIKALPEHTYEDCLPVYGKEKTQEIIDFTFGNVEALIKLGSELPADLQRSSEVRRVETLNLFTTEETFADLTSTIRAFDEANLNVSRRGRLIQPEELREKYGVANATGGYVSSAGAAWPYRLITGLFTGLLQQHPKRLNIEAQTPVQNVEATGNNQYLVHTPRGSIRTKTVVHSTNGHAAHLLPGLRGPLFPVRGQMTAQTPTKVAEQHRGKRSWSIAYDAGFDYITQSRETGEMFIGGGLAQSFEHGLSELGNVDDSSNSVLAFAHLGGALNATFGLDEKTAMSAGVKATWTGVMGFTSDGLPLVGQLPKEATLREGQGEWIAAGFNGYGMANAWLCGKHIADRVLQSENAEPIPSAYGISASRLQNMSAEAGAVHWIDALGLEGRDPSVRPGTGNRADSKL